MVLGIAVIGGLVTSTALSLVVGTAPVATPETIVAIWTGVTAIRPWPIETALTKELDHVHPLYAKMIEASPFFILATLGVNPGKNAMDGERTIPLNDGCLVPLEIVVPENSDRIVPVYATLRHLGRRDGRLARVVKSSRRSP